MTKKTIFTLFLTTVISSGAVFAMDPDLFSPPTKSKLLALPGTPQIEAEARDKFPTSVFTPESAAFQATLHVDRMRQERDAEKGKVIAASGRRALEKRVAAEKQAIEEENQKQIEALTLKMSLLQRTLEGHKVDKTEADREAEKLTLRIAALELEKKQMAERIAVEKQRLEEQIEQDRVELEAQKDLEQRLLQEKIILEEQIALEKAEVENQKALGRQIELEKDDLAAQSLLEKNALLEELDKEKLKKKAAMDASKSALEQMKSRLTEITRQANTYAAERDELVLKTELLQTTEDGLRRQIALVHSRLDATRGADSDDEADLDGGKPLVISTPVTTGGSGTGDRSASTTAKPGALPKSNLAGVKKK